MIEATELRALYELRREDDLSSAPLEVPLGGAGSLLSALGATTL